MNVLDRKLFRDLMRLKGQALTIALVVAVGVANYITLRSAWRALGDSRATYYEEYRFADVFARLKRAPDSVADQIHDVRGVATVYPRVVEEVRRHFNCSDLEGAELEGQGGDGTALTHWEKRIFQNEAMTGTVHTENPVYSRLTFALLEDSGWYLPNYDLASPKRRDITLQPCAFDNERKKVLRTFFLSWVVGGISEKYVLTHSITRSLDLVI